MKLCKHLQTLLQQSVQQISPFNIDRDRDFKCMKKVPRVHALVLEIKGMVTLINGKIPIAGIRDTVARDTCAKAKQVRNVFRTVPIRAWITEMLATLHHRHSIVLKELILAKTILTYTIFRVVILRVEASLMRRLFLKALSFHLRAFFKV
ncbi:hypothetical protein CHS0354_030881 [Potamilus streckersoni]|uniref:Uncharacterized protein n=1 Tax=Potamilus streckersoni TaxID=2493646 RepID=A0AAE0VZT8_9BIVA|nr:hypothetical protein CHS0354_030881 [Potamilus streckersoni]